MFGEDVINGATPPGNAITRAMFLLGACDATSYCHRLDQRIHDNNR